MLSKNVNMIKLWLYELGWLGSWGISFSIVNEALQTVLLILGIISAFLAIRQTLKGKK